MSAKSPRPKSANRTGKQDIHRQAAEWFAVLHDENVSEDDRKRWQEWLAADPAHARIWQRVEAISQPFAQAADAASAEAVRETLDKARVSGRRRALRLLGLGGVALGTGLLLRQTLPWQAWLHGYAVAHAAYRTRIGEHRQLKLPDGTLLAINTATAVDVEFGRELRRIVLHEGEILVDSAPDTQSPARPLVVDTSCGRLTALGTRFSVRGGRQSGQVAVFEGRVRVAPVSSGPLDVVAGQQARFTAAGVDLDGRADPARESWTRGQLIADNIPLADFIVELSRYTTVPLSVSPDAAHLRLVGVYPVADPDRDVPAILAALEGALPVRVQRTPAGGLLISPR